MLRWKRENQRGETRISDNEGDALWLYIRIERERGRLGWSYIPETQIPV